MPPANDRGIDPDVGRPPWVGGSQRRSQPIRIQGSGPHAMMLPLPPWNARAQRCNAALSADTHQASSGGNGAEAAFTFEPTTHRGSGPVFWPDPSALFGTAHAPTSQTPPTAAIILD